MASLYCFLFYRDVHVLLGDILVVGEDGILLGLDDDVLQVDVLDWHLGQTIELHGTSGTIANDVLDVDIAEDWRLFVDRHLGGIVGIVAVSQHLSHRLAAIVHIEGDGVGLDVSHRDVADEDVLHDAATTTRRLEAQPNVGTQELATLDEDVLDTTAHLGTYHETTMSGKNGTAVHDDILAGDATTATVGILTALDADTVVASIKLRIDDEGILARLQVEGVAILGVGGVTREYII